MENAIFVLNNAISKKENIPILEKVGIVRIEPKNLPPTNPNQKCK